MTFHLSYKRLDIAFLISLLLTIFFPILFPSLKLMFFAPFLIIALYQRPLPFCLLLALVAGIVIDLLSSYHRFGITSLNYFICLLLLYPQKKHFFADRLSTLSLMTFSFSSLSLLIHYLIYPIPISWSWVMTDGMAMPLLDALFAFFLYTVPALLISGRPRKGKDYFLA